MLSVPLTFRFERLLGREIAKAMFAAVAAAVAMAVLRGVVEERRITGTHGEPASSPRMLATSSARISSTFSCVISAMVRKSERRGRSLRNL